MNLAFKQHVNNWWWGKSFDIIVDNGIGIASVKLDNEYPDTAYVEGLSVLEQYRHNGYGHNILKRCEVIAENNNKRFIKLDVEKQNSDLINWYTRCGYSIYYIGEHVYTMIKVIQNGK